MVGDYEFVEFEYDLIAIEDINQLQKTLEEDYKMYHKMGDKLITGTL